MIRTLPILHSGQRLSASDAAKVFLHTSHLTSVFLRFSSLIFSFILFPPAAKLQTFSPLVKMLHYSENPGHTTLFCTEQNFRAMLRMLGRKIDPELRIQLMLSPLVTFLNSCSWKVSSLAHHSLTHVLCTILRIVAHIGLRRICQRRGDNSVRYKL